jgi:hypothetical protein
MKEFILKSEDATRRVHCHAQAMSLFPRVIGSHQMLASIFDPLDGPPKTQCCKAGQNVLGIKLPAYSESASRVPLEEMHRVRAASEQLCKQIAGPVRDLRSAMHFENIANRIETCDDAPRLQRNSGMATYL